MKDVIVFTTWDEPMADMAMNFLRDAGICAVKKGEVPRSVLPFTIDGLGEIVIRVPEEDFEEALEIISVRFSEVGIDPFEPPESGEDESPESSDSGEP